MATDYVTVTVKADGGPVSAKVHCPDYPQSIAGVFWRYNAKKVFETKAGVFSTQIPEVPLGGMATIDQKLFLVEGAVLSMKDDPPTPYQVVVEILQDGDSLHRQVPEVGGAGSLGSKNIPFLFRFKLEADT